MTDLTFTTTSQIDGLMLFGRSYMPQSPKAVINLVHGLGEHSGRYAQMAEWFNGHDIGVNLIDLRGHGQSMGKRGACTDIELMLDDIAALMEYTRNNIEDIPHYLMGHSMGGLLVLAYALQRPIPDIKGVISQAPALRPVHPPKPSLISFLKFIRRFWPNFSAANGLDVNAISKDKEVVSAYVADPLVHNKITAALALDMLATGEESLRNASTWEHALLLIHGDDDALTSCDASREFAAKAGIKCQFNAIEGGYHEVHNDPEKETVYNMILKWMRADD